MNEEMLTNLSIIDINLKQGWSMEYNTVKNKFPNSTIKIIYAR